MQEKKIVIAAFDFDGTITTKDTLFDFIIFYVGKFRFIVGLFVLSPILILHKIGIIKNSRAKEIMFSYFFKGKSIEDFNKKCHLYATRIESILKDSTISRINEHKQANHAVVIVSASISNWIKPWAYQTGIKEVISTEIEIKDGVLTGKFASPNCYGPEKVNRLKEKYPNRDEYVLYAYGDSQGDKELLEFANYPTLLKER